MTYHTWKNRFKSAMKNKNWKKIVVHEGFEYSVVGTIVISLQSTPESWILGIGTAFVIHMVLFEAVDAIHRKDKHIHKYLPKCLHWIFEHDHDSHNK